MSGGARRLRAASFVLKNMPTKRPVISRAGPSDPESILKDDALKKTFGETFEPDSQELEDFARKLAEKLND